MREALEDLAQKLAAAWRERHLVPLPEASKGVADRAEAYAVQDRFAALIGGEVVGWKVGAPNPAVQFLEGHDGPIPGRVFAERCFDQEGRVGSEGLMGATVESEFAFRLMADLPPGDRPLSRGEIIDLLEFHPAIELAATRYAPGTGGRRMTTHDGIADNGTGSAAIIGAAVPGWRDLDFATMEIEARIDDSLPLQCYTGPYRRDPVLIMAETLSGLRARGIDFTPGMVLLTGSATVPTPISKGRTLRVRFADLPLISLSIDEG